MFNGGQNAASLGNALCFSAVPTQHILLAAAEVWGKIDFLDPARSRIKAILKNQTDVDGPFIRFNFPLVSCNIRAV